MASRDRLTGGELNGALTAELVGVQTGYLGHGPKTAFTFYRGNCRSSRGLTPTRATSRRR
jgi:hypothetical protein